MKTNDSATDAIQTKEEEAVVCYIIREIWFRKGGTSLEGGFFMALLLFLAAKLSIEKALQETLGLEFPIVFSDKLKFKFVSAAQLKEPLAKTEEKLREHHIEMLERGILTFNVGDKYGRGIVDHHGDDDNSQVAIDLLRSENYDYVEILPWILDVYLKVSFNDANGTAITQGAHTLRNLMTALVCLRPEDDHFSLRILTNAFVGSIVRCKQLYDARTDENDSPDYEKTLLVKEAILGLESHDPKAAKELAEVWAEAQKAAKKDFQQACNDVEKAIKEGAVADLKHKLSFVLKRSIRAIMVKSDAASAAKAARRMKNRFDLVMVIRSDGSWQIFCSDIFNVEKLQRGQYVRQRGSQYRIDLGPVARTLRCLEQGARKRRMKNGNWSNVGLIYDTKGDAIPIYLADFKVMIANGTLGAPNVPRTFISHNKIWNTLLGTLKECPILIEKEDEWVPAHHLNNPRSKNNGRTNGKNGRGKPLPKLPEQIGTAAK